ncbi:MAG: adenylyltransferase/cytidyltransferase family protein [Acidobacteria bacterium]|nr:adenylyltransferase/cytidyltransferase family protein [Acidobacteriota bacterium]MDA1233698.1 adenylyltransferase/cytidyltransferase family protein [Acidobacteriota bacterium]
MGAVMSWDELAEARNSWKAAGEKVVFTNGCFDLLHPGHVRVLEKSRNLGDRLIVAINGDDSVHRLKGPTRPILDERERAETLAGFAAVDAVAIFDQDTPEEIIARIVPDILVKGADWAHWVAGRDTVEAAGGEVKLVALEPGFSTTDVVEKVLTLHGVK